MRNLRETTPRNISRPFSRTALWPFFRCDPADDAVELAFGWGPTEPVATRPLWMHRRPGGYNLFYSHDGGKNVSELVF